MEKVSIAVLDLSIPSLDIYDVPEEFDSEQTEAFLEATGHHMSNCSWGVFEGEINDNREK